MMKQRGIPLSVRIIGITFLLVTLSFSVMAVLLIQRVAVGVQANEEHNLVFCPKHNANIV
jgi:hypothetical protein